MCFVVVIHWLIFPYPSGLLHWHCGNLTIAPVPAKQPWWIWINTSSEFIMNDCITTTKQSTTKPCAYFLGYTLVRLTTNSSNTRIKGHAWGPVTWSLFAYRHVILACARLGSCRFYFLHGIMQMFAFYIHCVDINEPWTTTKRNGHPYRLSIMCLSLMCYIHDG